MSNQPPRDVKASSKGGDRYQTPKAVGPSRPTYEKSTRVPVSGKPVECNTASQKFVDCDPKSKHRF